MAIRIKTVDRTCLAVIIIVSLVCGYWALSWGIKQQRLIRQENELLSRKLKDLNLAETNLQRLKAVLDSTRKELKVLNERIPDSAKIGEFLKQVDALMNEREIDLVRLNPQPVVEEKNCNRIPVQLVFKGTFINVYRLVHDLETMNRTVVMEKMKISKPNNAQVCHVDLTANVFERF
jgi:Tfp pilus assembly protein PilO